VVVMYIVAMYDVGKKRVGKMLKLFRQYLSWIQNSVFEGEITEVKLIELKQKAKMIMNEETDSLIIFKTRQEKWLDKEIVGLERQNVDTFL
jgi:CRISPR-associated protein Cas2